MAITLVVTHSEEIVGNGMPEIRKALAKKGDTSVTLFFSGYSALVIQSWKSFLLGQLGDGYIIKRRGKKSITVKRR